MPNESLASKHPRTILITEASRGTALTLAHATPGRRLILLGSDAARLAAIGEGCKARGASVLCVTFDLPESALFHVPWPGRCCGLPCCRRRSRSGSWTAGVRRTQTASDGGPSTESVAGDPQPVFEWNHHSNATDGAPSVHNRSGYKGVQRAMGSIRRCLGTATLTFLVTTAAFADVSVKTLYDFSTVARGTTVNSDGGAPATHRS
jgi:hypothetical protein